MLLCVRRKDISDKRKNVTSVASEMKERRQERPKRPSSIIAVQLFYHFVSCCILLGP